MLATWIARSTMVVAAEVHVRVAASLPFEAEVGPVGPASDSWVVVVVVPVHNVVILETTWTVLRVIVHVTVTGVGVSGNVACPISRYDVPV